VSCVQRSAYLHALELCLCFTTAQLELFDNVGYFLVAMYVCVLLRKKDHNTLASTLRSVPNTGLEQRVQQGVHKEGDGRTRPYGVRMVLGWCQDGEKDPTLCVACEMTRNVAFSNNTISSACACWRGMSGARTVVRR
jgi:hypothetical protein